MFGFGLKTVKMSVEDWRRLFGTSAHDALNAQTGNTVDGYLQTLIVCDAILSGKKLVTHFSSKYGSLNSVL